MKKLGGSRVSSGLKVSSLALELMAVLRLGLGLVAVPFWIVPQASRWGRAQSVSKSDGLRASSG